MNPTRYVGRARVLRGLAMGLLVLAGTAHAEPSNMELALRAGSVRLEGNSTLHEYSSGTSALVARASVEPKPGQADAAAVLAAALDGKHTLNLEVRVPVKNLRSGKPDLDRKLQETLKADKHADIVFRLQALAAKDGGKAEAKGTLTIAGRERPVTLLVDTRVDAGALRASGSVDLKMTDFGIEPPTMMFGALKTDDLVRVKFDASFSPVNGSSRS